MRTRRACAFIVACLALGGAPARSADAPGVRALAVDAHGDVFVSRTNPDAILVFSAGATGDVAPARIIQGYRTDLADPQSIAVDGSGRIYVFNANPGNSCKTVAMFDADAKGDVAPVAEITGRRSGLCAGGAGAIAVDASGSIYVTRQDENSVEVFVPGSDGDAVPAAVIGGPDHAKLHGPLPISIAASGEIYVGNIRTTSERAMSVTGGPNGPTYNPDYTIEPPDVASFAAGSSGDAVRAANFDFPVSSIASGRPGLALIGARENGVTVLERWQADSAGAWARRAAFGGFEAPIGVASGARDHLFVLDNRCANASTGAALLEYRWGSAANATPLSTIAGARTRLTCP